MRVRRPGALFLGAAAALALAGALVPLAQAAYPRTISFSGKTWSVKTSAGPVGPGPNTFSDAASNVSVDAQGRLHLVIENRGGVWTCAEVISQSSFGYGTYRWYLDSPVDALDPYVVLGLFTWSDRAQENHREIDIELSRWSDAGNLNAQYVVQPYTLAANIRRFQEPASVPQSTHAFTWKSSSVSFLSLKGLVAAPPDPSAIVQQWSFTKAKAVPRAGGENARMNLWLFQGHAPLNGSSAEVIVNRFEFVPAG